MALVIVGAASSLVAINMPAPEPPLAAEARTLAARLTVAADEAIVSGRPVGVTLDETGYAFRRRVAGAWRAIDDDPTLAPRTWPEGADVETVRDGVRLTAPPSLGDAPRAAAPAVRFDPEGAATAIDIVLRDDREAFHVVVDHAGVVSIVAEEER
jgi:general secretion pathway protein H